MNDHHLSKFLSLVLRHQPEQIGITLDEEGWTSVPLLLEGLARSWKGVQRSDLERIVAEDKKQRYALRGDLIRANQGHSVAGVCAVELVPVAPPEFLYHGTTQERWGLIQASSGLLPGARHHVHLSADQATARTVGSRHRGDLVVLQVRAQDYVAAGGVFYRAENGVWMADTVPLEFISCA